MQRHIYLELVIRISGVLADVLTTDRDGGALICSICQFSPTVFYFKLLKKGGWTGNWNETCTICSAEQLRAFSSTHCPKFLLPKLLSKVLDTPSHVCFVVFVTKPFYLNSSKSLRNSFVPQKPQEASLLFWNS